MVWEPLALLRCCYLSSLALPKGRELFSSLREDVRRADGKYLKTKAL